VKIRIDLYKVLLFTNHLVFLLYWYYSL